MATRVIRSVVVVALAILALAGCNRQVSQEPLQDTDLPAAGPNRDALPVPRPWVASALDATGGLAAWSKCTRLRFGGVVAAYEQEGGPALAMQSAGSGSPFYLTEHEFAVSPWSDAIRVSAREPRAELVWQVAGGRYQPPRVDLSLDVSPLRGFYREYAEAVLQITTAPVRMLDENVVLTRRPGTVQFGGQWYHPIDAQYRTRQAIMVQPRGADPARSEPYWTQGTYYQNQDRSLVDMIWLSNPAAQRFLIVRGYDYAPIANGVSIPAKLEIFQSGPEAALGPRLAMIDLKQ